MCWESGAPLYWPGRQVRAVTASGSVLHDISSERANEVLRAALTAWTNVDCGGSPPSIDVASTEIDVTRQPLPLEDPDIPDDAEDGRDGANTLYFIDSGWPHNFTDIALTTTTFGVESGRLLEADIEVNGQDYVLTASDDEVVVDLLSVLTHEAGHFFGLSHVYDEGPTMYDAYTGVGSVTSRSLESDDIAGMCAIYPPDRFDVDAEAGCGCRVAGAPNGHPAVFWLSVVSAATWLRRRRSRLPTPAA
jgi:MYXO-CTERM domain-containing protein